MQKHDENIEQCKNIFPTWTWVVGMLAGCISICAIGAYSYATNESKQDNIMSAHGSRLEKVERGMESIDRINVKLDTLLVRKKKSNL